MRKNIKKSFYLILLIFCSIQLSAREFTELDKFTIIAKMRIESNIQNKDSFKGLKTTILFEINDDGTIKEHKLTKPSSNKLFNKAVIDAVYKSSPYTHLIKQMKKRNENKNTIELYVGF